ncbi:MAG: hypothetical protein KF805_01330 [Phycisphaeraceae bacterium]|nr:hypothetical protein [Phycisphaeraceae bacterium]
MQTRKIGRTTFATISALVALSGGAASSLAQLGAFPASDFQGKSLLPFQLELAISAKAPSTASASLMRAAIVRSMHSTQSCYASNLSNEQWQSLMDQFQFLPPTQDPIDPNDPFNDRFNVDLYRWGPGGTANSSFPSGAATATNLTVSFPNDGPTWGLSASGFSTAPNALGASLTSQFGNLDRGREYLRQCLGGWRRYGGITYTEVADDNTLMTNSAIHNNSRGDIRIGGISLNGQGGVLAYNCFPSPGGLAGSLTGGDMVINTAYFGDASTFNSTSNNYRYFRNVCTHEHGHGLGFIHQVPCSSTKLMEPFIQTLTDGVRIDDRRAAGRNYGDRFSGNQSLATAQDFGNLTTPALRSIAARDLSLNGYVNGGTNATGADFFRFTLDSAQNVKIIATPTGGTYTTGQQSSNCSGSTTAYATSFLGDLAYVLTNSDGTVTIGTVDATAAGAAETFTFSNLAAGSYVLQVFDNNAANLTNGSNGNTIVQLYDLEIQVGTNVYADPYANAGINKRIGAGLVCYFMGDINSGITENRVAETISRYEWDLDGDGVFETGVAPAASVPKPTFTYVSNGTYPVTLRVRDSQGKTGTDTINVVVFGATTTFTGTAISGDQGTSVPFTIVGTNLKNVTSAAMVTVTTGTGVTVSGTPVPNAMGTEVTGLSFVIDSGASVGGHNVKVSNSDGNATFANFLTVNAVVACPGDINGDTFVDDSDFVLFAAAYDLLDCADPSMPVGCPADLNGDGFVDDADFVLFSAAYDAYLCP